MKEVLTVVSDIYIKNFIFEFQLKTKIFVSILITENILNNHMKIRFLSHI